MNDFEKWLDEEYTVAKLTLLAGQINGRHLTEEETNKLMIEYDLLERVYLKFQEGDTYGSLLKKIERYTTPIQKIAEIQGVEVETILAVVTKLTPDQANSLMESVGIKYTYLDIDIEMMKRKISKVYNAQLEQIKKDVDSIISEINK